MKIYSPNISVKICLIIALFFVSVFAQAQIEVRTSYSSDNYVVIPNGDTSPSAEKLTDFGDLSIYAQKNNYLYIVNIGTTDITFSSSPTISITGSSGSWEVNSISTTITPGNLSGFYIYFDPETLGNKPATVTLYPDGYPAYTFAITGNAIGTYGTLEVKSDSDDEILIPNGDNSPTIDKTNDFGNVSVFAEKKTNFKLKNISETDGEYIVLDTYASNRIDITLSGTNADQFELSTTIYGLESSLNIANGSFKNQFISFKPTSTGLKRATVTIKLKYGSPSTYTFDIQGTGISSYGNLEVISIINNTDILIPNGDTNPSVDKNTDLGVFSSSRSSSVYLRNNSTIDGAYLILGEPKVTITGPNANDFNFGLFKKYIANGSKVDLSLRFNPTSSGVKRATYQINTEYGSPALYEFDVIGGRNINVLDNGTILEPINYRLSSSPSPDSDFGAINEGSTVTKTFTITNDGSDLVVPNAIFDTNVIEITGLNASDFSLISGPSAGAALNSGQSQNFTIAFTPSGSGYKEATIIVNFSQGRPEKYAFAVKGHSIISTTDPNILIPGGAEWKYYNSGNEPSGNWKDISYDDSTWDSGYVPFSSSKYFRSHSTFLNTVSNTIYYRHTFNVDDTSLGNYLH